MTNNDSYELMDISSLIFLLECSKLTSSDTLVIPRCIFQNSVYSSIVGVKANTIYSVNSYESIATGDTVVFWKEESLQYIALAYSSIAPFMRAIINNSIERVELHYKTFIVNGERKSIATSMTATIPIKVNTPTGEVDWIPNIPLLPPYQIFDSIKNAVNLFETSKFVAKLNPQDNEFIDIWNQRATDGAKVWIPRLEYYKEEVKPYILYLSKTMFSVAKSDTLTLEIRDNIPGYPGHFFMTKFSVNKKKKKMGIQNNYYMMEIII